MAIAAAWIDGRPWLPQAVVLPLMAGLGAVLVRYASTYLSGQPGQPRFVAWFLATLAAASMVVVTDHLVALVVAWFATSLALQRLLTFFADRPGAQMAAHKKFLVSRVADLCMLTAVGLLGTRAGTFDIDALAAHPAPAGAAVLVAIACLLKTAQLPVHGWLMQVMEAPTPVSALLHAGVVNLGGVVLIRLAPLLEASPTAQALLVVVGTLTAVLAALVATTRVSAKATLAWSTCAQMGFMVMQCGLGLYELAMLHLVAHSLYKAHAFLRAGSAVAESIARSLVPPAPSVALLARLSGLAGAMLLSVGTAHLLGLELAQRPELLALVGVVGIALAPLLVAADGRPSPRGAATAVALAVAYFAAHRALHGCLGHEVAPAPALAAGFVLVACLAQFAAQSALALAPQRTRRLRAWLQSGLFFDEWLTRATLRVWPISRSPLAS